MRRAETLGEFIDILNGLQVQYGAQVKLRLPIEITVATEGDTLNLIPWAVYPHETKKS